MDEIFTKTTFILKGTPMTFEHATTEMRGLTWPYKGHPLYESTAPPVPQVKVEEFNMDKF
jgi:hypothetical protein